MPLSGSGISWLLASSSGLSVLLLVSINKSFACQDLPSLLLARRGLDVAGPLFIQHCLLTILI